MIRRIALHLERFHRDQRGAVLVEMTLVAPLILLLSAGVFEFGNLIHDRLLMQAGLTDAARFAARCNSQLYTEYQDSGFPTIDCAGTAANIAIFGNPDGTGNPRVADWDKQTPNVTVTIGTDCHDSVVAGVTQYRSVTPQVCIVRADGTFAYSGIGMLSLVGIGPIALNSFHEERLIRF